MTPELLFYGLLYLPVVILTWFCVDERGRRTQIQIGSALPLAVWGLLYGHVLRYPQDEWGHAHIALGLMVSYLGAITVAFASRFAPFRRTEAWRWWHGPIVALAGFVILWLLWR